MVNKWALTVKTDGLKPFALLTGPGTLLGFEAYAEAMPMWARLVYHMNTLEQRCDEQSQLLDHYREAAEVRRLLE